MTARTQANWSLDDADEWKRVGLGTDLDTVIAKRSGKSRSAVTRARILLGIPRYQPPASKTSSYADAFVPEPTAVVLRMQSLEDRMRDLFGSISMEEYEHLRCEDLAERFAMSPSNVQLWRRRLRLPVYKKTFNTPQVEVSWHEQPFGRMLDTDLGRALGVSAITVTRMRRKFHCPACRPEQRGGRKPSKPREVRLPRVVRAWELDAAIDRANAREQQLKWEAYEQEQRQKRAVPPCEK